MTVVLALLVHFGVQHDLVMLLERLQAGGPASALIFILMMALVVVLLLPGVFFTTGAGFVFGIVAGTVYVVLGTTLGAAAAFLIARHSSAPRIRRMVQSHRQLDAFSREAARHTFTVVLLTRLIPFFPVKVSNYVFGLTGFAFNRYVLASLIGFIPFSLHNVYLGSLAADLASLSAGNLQRTPWQWGMYGLGFVALVIAVIYFSRLAQAGLAQIAESGSQQPGASPLTQEKRA